MTEDDIIRAATEIIRSGQRCRTPRWPVEEFLARRGNEFSESVRRRIISQWPRDGLPEGSQIPGYPASKGAMSWRRAKKAGRPVLHRQRGSGQPVWGY